VDDTNGAVVFPENLSALSADELTALRTGALAEFDALAAQDDIDDAGIARLEVLATGIESVAAGLKALETRATTFATTKDRVQKLRPTVAPAETEAPVTPAETAVAADEVVTGEVVESEAVTAGAKVGGAVVKRETVRVPSLAAAQAAAPVLADRRGADDLVIVAAAASSGIQMGSRFDSMDSLVSAFQNQARSLVITNGRPGFQTVATIKNHFEHVIDGDRTSPGEFEAMIRELRNPEKIDDLVAAGGWCAPSEIRYDFFNIVCQDGMVDLPTFGVQRGGIQFPVSPSLADVFTGTFTNATNPWLWTEADDILAVTGSPTKPCVRVLCPDFDEVRLECYGICLTAGNLTDFAYPEATRNHLSLLLAAHYHAMNQRFIQQMVALSTSAIVIPTGSCRAISSDLPDIVGLAAQDYRTRFGMCDDDVLEVILPRWARDAIRSDLSRRTALDPTNYTNADIDRLFTTRRVRIQWVNDWQIRTAGQPGGATALTAWPDTVDFMIYAAGTFVKGNGLVLDLGVVRDSVLNETNDHTAAWSEECHLIARYGHESRLYRLPVCVGGLTGGTCSECHVA
jgi:hypothetical protein